MAGHFAPISDDSFSDGYRLGHRRRWSDSTTAPNVVWGTGSLVSNMTSVLERRLVDAAIRGLDDKPFSGATHAGLADVAAFLSDSFDDAELFALGADLAAAVGYLGRAESWTECEALADWHDEPSCGPMETGFSGGAARLLAPLSPAAYTAERNRLIAEERRRISSAAKKPPSAKRLETLTVKAFQSKASGADTLPVSLLDALTLDTADWQDRGWPRPPAAREVVYAREEKAAVGVIPRVLSRRRLRTHSDSNAPTVARFLLAGRPRPRVGDAVRIGELMRLAALSQFGQRHDDASGRRVPNAPWQISGRGTSGKPLRDPSHSHAFWLPEDADSDGLIDHISVFVAGGINHDIRAKLDRITRLRPRAFRPD